MNLRRFIVAILLSLHIVSAHASADRDPLDIPLRQYAFLLAIALFGGVVSWCAKVRAGTVQAWHLSSLIGELATSAFAGLLSFWLCAAAGVPPFVTAAVVGVAGHMGTRAIAMIEAWAQQRFAKALPPPANEPEA